jgi:molybdenum cofactor cytidylyltransferase
MGRPKLLLPWQSRPLVEAVVGAWRSSHAAGVVLVVHPDDSEIARLGRQAGAEVVVPSDPPADMKASVALGLERIAERWSPDPQDAWLVAPSDMPLLTRQAIDAVIAARPLGDDPRIVIPCYRGRHGHPVAIPWRLAPELAKLGAAEGLNALVARFPTLEFELPLEGILVDIDTPDDYRRLSESGGD